MILAAHTGARWSELTTLRWLDVRTNFPLDDGAISGPGRLRIRPPTPVDQEEEPASRRRPRSRPGGRTIALDQHAIDALNAHRDLVDGRARDLVFTSPAGELPRAEAGPDNPVVVQGCSHPTVSGAGFDASETAALITRLAVQNDPPG